MVTKLAHQVELTLQKRRKGKLLLLVMNLLVPMKLVQVM